MVADAKAGSRDALEELAARYWDDAYRTALFVGADPDFAEDVAQEALMVAIRTLPRFNPRRRFGPWLHRIAANRAIDHSRRASKLPRPSEIEELPAGAEELADPLPLGLIAALEALPLEDRAIVVLRHLFDYRSREIAAMLGIPAGTVRRRLSTALGRVRQTLDGGVGDGQR